MKHIRVFADTYIILYVDISFIRGKDSNFLCNTYIVK